MIRFQIVERSGGDLYRSLLEALRRGTLRTFRAERRGRRVRHTNPSYPGWMNWSRRGGIIACEVISPRKPGSEWRLFSAFLGRLADRYAGEILCIGVQFPDATTAAKGRPKRTRRRSRPLRRR